MRKYVIDLALLVLVACASSRAIAASPVQTLCELATNLDKYADQIVRVKAIYSTDMLEHSELLDPNCRSVQFNVYDGPKGPYQYTINKFNNALSKAQFAGRPVIFRVEFSAMLRLKPEPTENPFDRGELGRLHITRVWRYSCLPKVPARH